MTEEPPDIDALLRWVFADGIPPQYMIQVYAEEPELTASNDNFRFSVVPPDGHAA